MTTPTTAFLGARLFDGETWHDDRALLLSGSRIEGLVAPDSLAANVRRVDATASLIVPGFIDLQVNGGGGVMLNDTQSVEAIRRITSAHARFGTTALLPTLITDTIEITQAAIAAGRAARAAGVPGFLGLHLEGPHLSLARKGAHDPQLIRPMRDDDLARLLAAAPAFEVFMTTVAPENVRADQVQRLAEAGVLVSIGHTDATCETVRAYARAGARAVTHLFNAMSQLGNREPGVVGAALAEGGLSAGLIADGFHVDPVSIGVALAAKAGPGRVFLVTDAMSTIGTDMTGFTLNGRAIRRAGGKLTLADGTLAGADIDMLSSIRFLHDHLGLSLDETLRMASLYPARAARIDHRKGALKPGMDADFVQLSPGLDILGTWIGGALVAAD
nr:N-acetylglucosamine-6-phosphate deacetylase [uncultured Gellertiella sp.]